MDRRDLVIVAILLLLLASWIIGWTLGYPKPEKTGILRGYAVSLDDRIKFVQVVGSSMEPTFSDGDVLLWVEFDPENLRVGDIIYYWHAEHDEAKPIVHRIVEIERPGVVKTLGDHPDAWKEHRVEAENIEGLVIGVIFHSSSGW